MDAVICDMLKSIKGHCRLYNTNFLIELSNVLNIHLVTCQGKQHNMNADFNFL